MAAPSAPAKFLAERPILVRGLFLVSMAVGALHVSLILLCRVHCACLLRPLARARLVSSACSLALRLHPRPGRRHLHSTSEAQAQAGAPVPSQGCHSRGCSSRR